MKVSTQNQLSGTIVKMTRGAVQTVVYVELADGTIITSHITNRATVELGLDVGQSVSAVIQPSDVMLGVER